VKTRVFSVITGVFVEETPVITVIIPQREREREREKEREIKRKEKRKKKKKKRTIMNRKFGINSFRKKI